MPKSSQRNNPWGGLGNYGAVPVTSQKMQPDEEMGMALKARYPHANDAQLANALQEEMGLNPYQILSNLNSPNVRQDAVGQFSRDTGVLRVSPFQSPILKKATIMHELAHVADAVTDPAFLSSEAKDMGDGSVDDSQHFSGMKGERIMADSLKNQHLIEQGLPADPEALGNMPWLGQVAPLSSNKLANPWAPKIKHGKAVPAEAWNQSYDPRK